MKDRRQNKILCPKLILKKERESNNRRRAVAATAAKKKAFQTGSWMEVPTKAHFYAPKEPKKRSVPQQVKPLTGGFSALADSSDDELDYERPTDTSAFGNMAPQKGKKQQKPLVAPTRTASQVRRELKQKRAELELLINEVASLKKQKLPFWGAMADEADAQTAVDELEEELEQMC